jgi:hypothetical protein
MNLRNIRLGSRPLTIGLIFGVIFAFALIFYGYFLAQALGQFNTYIQLGFPLIFGLLAARRASMRTGKISSGMIAGLLTGAVGSLIAAIVTMITVLISIDAIRQQAQQSATKQHPIITNGDIIQYYLEALVISLIFTTLLAVAGGAFGGFLGRGRARVAPVEETPEEVITTTATPVQEDDETETPSYSSNGTRRSAASRRSRNARRNRNMN